MGERQQRVLAAAKAWIEAEGRPPTRRELAEALGVSQQIVSNALVGLMRRGYPTSTLVRSAYVRIGAWPTDARPLWQRALESRGAADALSRVPE